MVDEFEDGEFKYIWWGWRTSPMNNLVTGFWTAHRNWKEPWEKHEHYHCVVVRGDRASSQIGPYERGAEFCIYNSLTREDALPFTNGMNGKFAEEVFDLAFAEQKGRALDDLKAYCALLPALTR